MKGRVTGAVFPKRKERKALSGEKETPKTGGNCCSWKCRCQQALEAAHVWNRKGFASRKKESARFQALIQEHDFTCKAKLFAPTGEGKRGSPAQ